MAANPHPSSAWYRHFWPWFIVGLLVVSVVGSLLTVHLAIEAVAASEHRSEVAPVDSGRVDAPKAEALEHESRPGR